MGFRTLNRAAFLALTVLTPKVGLAEELQWTHYGVRPLGMGNAFVAVADDYNALFYNPAGLARLKEWDAELLNPYFEISKNTLKSGQDMSNLASAGASDTDAVLNLLEDNTGTNHHLALGLTPHFVVPGFGFGLSIEVAGSLAFHRDISVDLDVGPRVIIPVAFAKNFLEDRLSVGAGVKYVARAGVNHEFSIEDIDALIKNKSSSDTAATTGTAASDTGPALEDYVEGGTGVGADLGLLFTPVKTMQPTFGLSITDLGGTPYKKQNINGTALAAPAARLPSVNTGFSLRPWESGSMYLLTAIDADAINQPVHYSKKFNLGLEFGAGSILKLQTGLHQGELSAGFQFDVFLLTLRFATYTEQIGSFAGEDENLRDRRYVMQIKLLI